MNAPILLEERSTPNGYRIGIATLNAPATLNGLSLPMVDALSEALSRWENDNQMAAVVLQGAGDKAFCAGGDLHALYKSMRDYQDSGATCPQDNAHALAFFEREYRLDYQIHAYSKPILCWGHGIVMGGGIGLMSGASHRIVTEHSRLAMPETGIGLFPDVGGTWLLSRAPGHTGRFLALTGASINAADALYAGFADHLIAAEQHDALLEALTQQVWQADNTANRALVDTLLQSMALPSLPEGPLQQAQTRIDQVCAGHSLEPVIEAITATQSEDIWWQKAQAALTRACPSSLRLSWELQQRASRLSLAEVFKLELIAALACAAHGDFAEGIRALLIDKDKTPRWSPATLAEADSAFINAFLTPVWSSGEHPLQDLGSNDPQRTPLQ